ncbi:response regulator [Paenibacillus filicis]|uniref:Response regulator n=1 Tax=Paenibacillus filicis TaxID=669464 RepID=A0ABU9DJ34_9BACL
MREVITCLIVDDEPPMVRRLQRMFERWEEQRLPYRLIGTAYSADEGMELASRLKPDLIVTDVVMPGKNGLEMIRELRVSHPRIEFIILSSYSDFAYAKQAIAMGVFEYLVKVPLREQEVLAALAKARDNVLAWEERDRRLHSLSGSVKGDSHRMRKQLLEELLRGELSASAMKRRSQEYAPDFQPSQYACFVVRLDDYAGFSAEYSPADRHSLKYGMLNIMEEVLQASGGCFVCEMSADTLVGLSKLQAAGEHGADTKGLELAEEILAHMKAFLRLSVSIGVSRRHQGWEQAAAAYRQASAALADSFYFSFGMVVTPSRRLVYSEADTHVLFERFEGLLDRVSTASDRDELSSLLKLLHTYRLPPDKLIPYVERWLVRLRRKLLPAGHQLEDPQTPGLQNCAHLHQLTERLRLEWERIMSRATPAGLRPDMAKAILYVEERLHESLSLSHVADHIHLNPSYVSELFKKELGINFTDYVARRRIERAIELLRKRAYTNQELAEAVGIPNEKYFCTLFKKMTGTSPQKYETNRRRV